MGGWRGAWEVSLSTAAGPSSRKKGCPVFPGLCSSCTAPDGLGLLLHYPPNTLPWAGCIRQGRAGLTGHSTDLPPPSRTKSSRLSLLAEPLPLQAALWKEMPAQLHALPLSTCDLHRGSSAISDSGGAPDT